MSRFELVKIITFWQKAVQSNEKVAWLLHDHENQTDYGYTFEEAWQLINEFGAVNVAAKIRKTENREIKELDPYPPQPGLLDTSWQLKYEKTNDLTYSPASLENIHRLINIDEKWKIKRKKDEWLRTQKNLISTWRNYRNIMNCIEVAQQIQKSKNIVIYVGASVWQEAGLPKVYPANMIEDPNHFENLFIRPIETALSNMDIRVSHDCFKFIEFPYIFDFLRIIKNQNDQTEFLFEVEEGIFQRGKADTPIDLVLAIGVEKPIDVHQTDNIYYIGHEPCINPSPYKKVLHAPISQVLKEVESHFVLKGRMLCGVCGEKVAHGIGSSTIAPVQVAVCISCGSKGAQPYDVIVTRVALGKQRNENYRPGPNLEHVIQATLPIVGKSEKEFQEDVHQCLTKIIATKITK